MTLQLDLPRDMVDAVCVSGEDPSVAFKQELILGLFQRGVVASGRAAEVLGLSRREFNELVKDKQITLPLEISDFDAELETLKSLRA